MAEKMASEYQELKRRSDSNQNASNILKNLIEAGVVEMDEQGEIRASKKRKN